MEYTISQLSKLAGVTTRTLRWYDKIDLLKPSRIGDNNYRYYGAKEVDRLQDILFYRAIGVELAQIKEFLDSPSFNRLNALKSHLDVLKDKQTQTENLIKLVKDTIKAEERNEIMLDEKKFEAFKQNLIDKNENEYGNEIRSLYGNESIDISNQNIMNMTTDDYNEMEKLSNLILDKLENAVQNNTSPYSEEGKNIVDLHRKWLTMSSNQYSAEMHKGVANLYVEDERFKSYYDKNILGCAEFLRDAILKWA